MTKAYSNLPLNERPTTGDVAETALIKFCHKITNINAIRKACPIFNY